MNQILEDLFVTYATQSHKALREALDGLSRETLMATMVDLLTLYLNDPNSSTAREFITLRVAGYQPVEGKLGYNGYRMLAPKVQQFCEVKPVNVYHRENGQVSRKLNGGGNFSDYTPERLQQDLAQASLQMLVSGFVDGRLVYVLEFPFQCLERRLRELLAARFSEKERQPNEYLRSAAFSFQHYAACFPEEGRLVYRAADLDAFRDAMTRNFFHFLSQLPVTE